MKAAAYWFGFVFCLLAIALFFREARPWVATVMLGALVCISVGFARVRR